MKISNNIYYGLNKELKISIIPPESYDGQEEFKKNIIFFKKHGFNIKEPNFNEFTCKVQIKDVWEKWYLGWLVPYGINENRNLRIQVKQQPKPHTIDRIFAYRKFDNKSLFFLTEKSTKIVNKTEYSSSFILALSKQIYWKQNGDCFFIHKSKMRQTKILLFSDFLNLKKWNLNNFADNKDLKIIDIQQLKTINHWISEQIDLLKLKSVVNDLLLNLKTPKQNFKYENNTYVLNDNYLNKSIVVITKIFVRKYGRHWREGVLKYYNNQCVITGIDEISVLEACHVKPWTKSNSKEKFNLTNSILLSPTFHTLFDRGLITFLKNGNMIYSTKLTSKTIEWIKNNSLIKNNYSKKIIEKVNYKYLEFHQKNIFIK